MTYTYADAELAFGPSQAELRADLKAAFERRIGQRLRDEQWRYLARGARRAGNMFLFDAPQSVESRARLERLRLASLELKGALRDVIDANTQEEWIDPRSPPAETELSIALGDALDEADEHLLNDDEILVECARLAGIISSASEAATDKIRKPERGKGRKTTGYDEFLDICRDVWASIHGEDNWGFSVTKGRGSGPFVHFVNLAEALLPRLMWRDSLDNVGDAIVRRFAGHKRKRVSVTGTTGDSE